MISTKRVQFFELFFEFIVFGLLTYNRAGLQFDPRRARGGRV
jgi:hypothetical protein